MVSSTLYNFIRVRKGIFQRATRILFSGCNLSYLQASTAYPVHQRITSCETYECMNSLFRFYIKKGRIRIGFSRIVCPKDSVCPLWTWAISWELRGDTKRISDLMKVMKNDKVQWKLWMDICIISCKVPSTLTAVSGVI